MIDLVAGPKKTDVTAWGFSLTSPVASTSPRSHS